MGRIFDTDARNTNHVPRDEQDIQLGHVECLMYCRPTHTWGRPLHKGGSLESDECDQPGVGK